MNDRSERNERWKQVLMKLPPDKDFLPVQAECSPGILRRLVRAGYLAPVNSWTTNLRMTVAGKEQRTHLIAQFRKAWDQAQEAKAS